LLCFLDPKPPTEVISRKSSRQTRRKSSSSSAASILSQLQNARAALANAGGANAKDLGIQAIYRSASQRVAAIQRTNSIHSSTPISTTGGHSISTPIRGGGNLAQSTIGEREKRSSFFLLSPSMGGGAIAATPQPTPSTCFSTTQGNESWHVPNLPTMPNLQQQQNQRRKTSSGFQMAPPPPPPPTHALQRRIDAYCAAANINPTAEFQRSRSQHSRKDNQQSQLPTEDHHF
jgi:hypothetical protein